MVEGRKTLPAMNLQRCSLPIQPSGSSDHSQVRVRPELQASNLRKPPTSPPTLSATSAERLNPGTGRQATGKAEDSGPSSQRFPQSHSSSGSETGISKVPPDVPPCFTCPSPSNQDCTRPLLTENRYSFPERPLRTASRRHLEGGETDMLSCVHRKSSCHAKHDASRLN